MGRSDTESLRSPFVDFLSGNTVHLDTRVQQGEEEAFEQGIFTGGIALRRAGSHCLALTLLVIASEE